jgi:hypothetical protein
LPLCYVGIDDRDRPPPIWWRFLLGPVHCSPAWKFSPIPEVMVGHVLIAAAK